jgi:hypothetical protein
MLVLVVRELLDHDDSMSVFWDNGERLVVRAAFPEATDREVLGMLAKAICDVLELGAECGEDIAVDGIRQVYLPQVRSGTTLLPEGR